MPFKIFTSKPTGKSLPVKSKRRWEDNIRMGLKEIDVNRRNYSAQDRDSWRAFVSYK